MRASLDDTDLAIVRALQANARATYTEVGKAVGLSAASVHERVHRLETRGVIRGYHAEVDPVLLGLSVLSLVIMPALAWWKQRTGREMGSRALVADAAETWVCSYLSLALLAGVGL